MNHQPLEITEVHRLAVLCRLNLTQAEERQVMIDLESILTHVDKLASANVEDVAPLCHATYRSGPLRKDVVRPSLPVDEALKNAPERLGDGFGVPKIIE